MHHLPAASTTASHLLRSVYLLPDWAFCNQAARVATTGPCNNNFEKEVSWVHFNAHVSGVVRWLFVRAFHEDRSI